jgi:hypothetical protein
VREPASSQADSQDEQECGRRPTLAEERLADEPAVGERLRPARRSNTEERIHAGGRVFPLRVTIDADGGFRLKLLKSDTAQYELV